MSEQKLKYKFKTKYPYDDESYNKSDVYSVRLNEEEKALALEKQISISEKIKHKLSFSSFIKYLIKNFKD